MFKSINSNLSKIYFIIISNLNRFDTVKTLFDRIEAIEFNAIYLENDLSVMV